MKRRINMSEEDAERLLEKIKRLKEDADKMKNLADESRKEMKKKYPEVFKDD